jgi:hypothetical protein
MDICGIMETPESFDSLLFDTVLESPQFYDERVSELTLEIKQLEELRFKATLRPAKNATDKHQLESIANTLRDKHHFTDKEIVCLFFAAGGHAKDHAWTVPLPEFHEPSDDFEMETFLMDTISNSSGNRSHLVALSILDHLNELIVRNLYPRKEILLKMLEGQDEKIAQAILDRLDKLIPLTRPHPADRVNSVRSSILNRVLAKFHDKDVTLAVAVKSKGLPVEYYRSIILSAVEKAAKNGDKELADRLVKTIETEQLSEIKEALLHKIFHLKPDDKKDLETYIKAASPRPYPALKR